MPKCPKCGAEIDHLREFDNVEVSYVFGLDSKGRLCWDDQEILWDTAKIIEVGCPECEAILFKTESEAVAFLKGEPVPAQ